MASLVANKTEYDIATGNDADSDRHGIVTPDAGLMNPNHYLSAAIWYLFGNRPDWPESTAIGKTLVSSSMIDNVAAVEVLYAKGAKEAGDAQAFLAEKEAEYNTNFSNPYCAAERGYIDAVIEPAETRARIINALESIRGKRDTLPMKKHGNIPL